MRDLAAGLLFATDVKMMPMRLEAEHEEKEGEEEEDALAHFDSGARMPSAGPDAHIVVPKLA